ncbi:MAG: hypothetical protein WBD31_06915, partial [Rubripirellula sp.]
QRVSSWKTLPRRPKPTCQHLMASGRIMYMTCKNANQHELTAKVQLKWWQRLPAKDHPENHFRLMGNDKVPTGQS